jgi:hypothetical protein
MIRLRLAKFGLTTFSAVELEYHDLFSSTLKTIIHIVPHDRQPHAPGIYQAYFVSSKDSKVPEVCSLVAVSIFDDTVSQMTYNC